MNDGTVTFLYSIPWATEPEHLFITWSSTSELFLNCKDRLNSLWWMRQIERGLNYSIAFTPSLNQIEQSDSRSSSFFMVSLQSSSPVRSHSLRSSPYRSSCLSSLFILNHYWTYFFFVNSITFFLFPWTYCIDWFSLLPLAPLPLGRVARAPFPISSWTVTWASLIHPLFLLVSEFHCLFLRNPSSLYSHPSLWPPVKSIQRKTVSLFFLTQSIRVSSS